MAISRFPLPASLFAFRVAGNNILRYRAPADVEHYRFDPDSRPTPEVGTLYTFGAVIGEQMGR